MAPLILSVQDTVKSLIEELAPPIEEPPTSKGMTGVKHSVNNEIIPPKILLEVLYKS